MMMFLTLLLTSMLAVAMLSIIVLAGRPRTEEHSQRAPALRPMLEPSRFFAGDKQFDEFRQMPAELLLKQIERHVRCEQAAATTFVGLPTRETLHSPTASPFVN
jgi:hypothetical protein